MGFQNVVRTDPAPAVEGDFASANPRASMLAGVGALVAAAVGVTVGRFARARNDNGTVTNAHPGVACRLGFVHRDQPAIITPFLGASTLLVPSGLEIVLHDGGDFWARFAGGAAIGQKVFASNADGSAVAGTAGTAPQGAEVTATTNTTTTLNVTAVVSGVLAIGDIVTGPDLPAGTYIRSFGTGTGGVGTYILNQAATGGHAGGDYLAAAAQETQFYVHSTAAAGELAKISDRPVIGS
jgi:hypothetical protein